MAGQVVDTEVAQEFMRETLESVSADDLSAIVADLRVKSDRVAELVTPDRLAQADRGDLRSLLRLSFASRRRADKILDGVGADTLAGSIQALVGPVDQHPHASLAQRFEAFQAVLVDFPEAAFELPSEILHFSRPDHHWLWTRWMWDPRPETGALALVTDDEFDFGDGGPGLTYLKVGEANAFVSEIGRAAGFSAFEEGPFAVDVFLGCVYAVYMYTVLRLRMTQEFNRIVPQQTELIRRLLGVHRMEA